MSIWDKFDKAADLKGLQEDINEAKENGGGQFKEVPLGTYEVGIEKIELKETRNNDPMISIWFKILDGKFKNSRIFYNQVINQGFQIHIANEFLRSLETDIDIEFESYSQYNEMLMDVKEKIDEEGLEYALVYGENPKNKNFNTFKIDEVYQS